MTGWKRAKKKKKKKRHLLPDTYNTVVCHLSVLSTSKSFTSREPHETQVNTWKQGAHIFAYAIYYTTLITFPSASAELCV